MLLLVCKAGKHAVLWFQPKDESGREGGRVRKGRNRRNKGGERKIKKTLKMLFLLCWLKYLHCPFFFLSMPFPLLPNSSVSLHPHNPHNSHSWQTIPFCGDLLLPPAWVQLHGFSLLFRLCPRLLLLLCILKWNIRAGTAYTQTHSCAASSLALSSDGHSKHLTQHAEMLM